MDNDAIFMEDFRQFFNLADTNQNGRLDYKEIKKMLTETLCIKDSEETIEKWFNDAKVDVSKPVSFDELWKALGDKADTLLDIDMNLKFALCDNGQKRYLTKEECLEALRKMGYEDPQESMFKCIDGMDKSDDK